MTPEEFEKFKEAEKKHLRKLKELKKAVKTLERKKSVTTAFEKIGEGQDLLDKQKDLVDRLALETAQQEARLDVALESSEEAGRAQEAEALEEDLQRERAQALVRQLKRELGGDDFMEKAERGSRSEGGDTGQRMEQRGNVEDRGRTAQASSSQEEGSAGKRSTGRDDRPEKTIGRM